MPLQSHYNPRYFNLSMDPKSTKNLSKELLTSSTLYSWKRANYLQCLALISNHSGQPASWIAYIPTTGGLWKLRVF